MNCFHIIHKTDDFSTKLADTINRNLKEGGMIQNRDNPDLIIVVGGDGKLLRAVHYYIGKIESVAFVGIKTGTLGFYTDFEHDEVELLTQYILKKEYVIEEVPLLEMIIETSNKQHCYYALNEVRLENSNNTQLLDVYIDSIHLEKFRGNGLVVCSPLGSTAYNKSLGGAVISPNLNVLQLTEIAPIHNNIYNSLGSSLIIPGTSQIQFYSKSFYRSIIGFDHQSYQISGIKNVICRQSSRSVKFVRYRDYSYFERLSKCFIKD